MASRERAGCENVMKATVLAMTPAYLPGYKAGGSIRTLANLVERLGGELRFKIVTRDRDFGEDRPYPGIETGVWTRQGNADVLYLPPGGCSMRRLGRLIRSTPHDVLYLNSAFHPGFTLRSLGLRRLGRVEASRVIVAPRGELGAGALSSKSLKKRFFLALARPLGLYRGVVWQASTEREAADIRERFGESASVVVAQDLLPADLAAGLSRRSGEKRAGALRALLVSRISPEKNVKQAIGLLAALRGEVSFDIYGLIDNERYWRECRALIRRLPDHVRVEHRGVVGHDRLLAEISEHDLFFMPTLGENFGYAIVEALASGCPVLISDRTPWRDLERRGAGWDLPLEEPGRFVEVLQRCVDMDGASHRKLSERARAYGQAVLRDEEGVERNRALFHRLLGDD